MAYSHLTFGIVVKTGYFCFVFMMKLIFCPPNTAFGFKFLDNKNKENPPHLEIFWLATFLTLIVFACHLSDAMHKCVFFLLEASSARKIVLRIEKRVQSATSN